MNATDPVADEKALVDWVREHGVAWELSVRSETMGGHRTPVGLALTLASQCMGLCRTAPTCRTCRATQAKLLEIALAVVPDGTSHWLDPLEPSLHMRRAANWVPEVEATVVLRAPRPGAASDPAVAESIRERLLRMGARPRA